MLLPSNQNHRVPKQNKAQRVLKSIPKKIGRDALELIRNTFLTCHPQKELLILKFLRLGFSVGSSVMNRLTDETVHALLAAVQHLLREVEHYLGFVRFSEANGVLTSVIEPKNIVLPLVAQHFCERFPNEQFIIYDKTHRMALLHQDRKAEICDVEDFELPSPGEEEMKFRELWRLFYDTIEIKGRRNPRCRMNHMPKRFWNHLTEFDRVEKTDTATANDSDYSKTGVTKNIVTGQRGLAALPQAGACAPGHFPLREIPQATLQEMETDFEKSEE